MYFLKNSRCVLRKSQWFSSNVIERNFKINFGKSRVKWPEDDPTKPPLRLNLPKDPPLHSPYNFPPQIQLNTPQNNINNEKKLTSNWLTPGARMEDVKTEPTSDKNLQENSISFDMSENLNYPVRSISSETLSPIWNTDETGKVKNFKLKKTRSYEELTQKTDSTLRAYNPEENNSILTIEIELNDQEGEKPIKVVETQDVASDEQIKAMAEAIANEINTNKGNVDAAQAKPNQEEEAFLVIINVTDKDIVEDIAAEPQLPAKPSTQHPKLSTSESLNALDDGCYGAQIKVRNLGFSTEVQRNVCNKRLGRSRRIRESDTPTVASDQVLRSLESVLGNHATLDGNFDGHVRQQTQYNRDWREYRSLKSAEDLSKEKEKRKEVFESTIRRVRATRNHFPVGRMQTMCPSKKKLSTSTGNTHEELVGGNLPKSIDHGGVQKRDCTAPKTELTPIEELPEVLMHLEYNMLRKSRGEIRNMEDDNYKKPSTIRSYHNSCINQCKLTMGEEKPTIVVMNLDKKSGTDSKGEGCDPKEGSVKTDPLRQTKEYPKNKLDNVLKESSQLSDLNGSNDIYLQEESVVGIKAQRTEEKTVQKINKLEFSKGEDGLNDERYELDIVDVRKSPEGVKVPYSAAYPSNRAVTQDEERSFEIFKDLAEDTFEMNVKCLSMDEGKPSGTGADGSTAEPPANRIEAIGMTTPKLSDNIVNLANEDLTESKEVPPPVDSLSLMLQVREMVDMDLKNAEMIFMVDEMETAEKKSVPPTENITLTELKSVVIYKEETNQFFINANELEHALLTQKHELSQTLDNLKVLDVKSEELKGDLSVYVPNDLTNVNTNYILKSGESIIVYDEKTRKWNVDFSLLREKEQQHEGELNKKGEISPPEIPPGKPQKDGEPKEDPCLLLTITPEVLPITGGAKVEKDTPGEQVESEKNSKGKKEPRKEMDAKEIRRKNSDLYDDVFMGIKKPDTKKEREGSEAPKWAKKAGGVEKSPTEHYVSENIVEMSRNNTIKPRSNKVETVKLNITPKARPPSKVTEINLKKKNEDGKGSTRKDSGGGSEDGNKKNDKSNGTFYKKFEKYKTPFSDPEYEDRPMKIKSDLDSNPNLNKLDTWNKTLVLQEFGKSPDKVEGWLKDETDKMATLLLKVLQDAADGNSRRRVAGKSSGKGNPYEVIRKKQENNSNSVKGKKKEQGKRRYLPVQVKKSGNELAPVKGEKKLAEERSRKGQFPIIEDETHVEILTPDSHLPKEPVQVSTLPLTIVNERLTDDIPGPYVLKQISSLWRYLPDLGCQTTIFLVTRIFYLAKTGLLVFSPDAKRSRNDPFRRLFMKYGPVVKLQGPFSGNVVLINRPEDLSSVFVQARVNPACSVLDSVENCRARVRKKNFPLGITQSCRGTEWDLVRNSMIDIASKGCLQYFNMLRNTDTLFVNKIQNIRNNQNQVPDDFINEVKKWSMEGLCGVLLDKSLGFLEDKNSQVQWISESERFMRHLGEATDHLSKCESSFQTWRFINTPSMRGLNQAYQSLDLIISKYVYQAELTLRRKKKALTTNKTNANKNLNFLESMLLNDRMAPDEITANLIDMFLIGVNTTTVALAFLLYNLAQNNRVQRLLFKEIKDLLPTKTSMLNYHQLHSLKYLQACLKESTRLNTPIPLLLRVLPNDISLANYRVPYGAHIIMDTQTACMRDQVFDDPEIFKPERWLEQDCVHPFASVPFSNGPRADFVKRLAEIQLWTCAAQIVRNFQIEYHFGEIRGSRGVISYPDKPLRLTFIERKD